MEAGLNLRPHDRGRIFIPGRKLIRTGIRVADTVHPRIALIAIAATPA